MISPTADFMLLLLAGITVLLIEEGIPKFEMSMRYLGLSVIFFIASLVFAYISPFPFPFPFPELYAIPISKVSISVHSQLLFSLICLVVGSLGLVFTAFRKDQ